MAAKQNASILGESKPSKAIIKLALPATLALLAKAVYNILDTAYIGMLKDDIALTAVGVTVPLLLIMVSIENIFAAGAAVLAGRQLGAKDEDGASRTVTTIIGLSIVIGAILCVGGIVFIEPLMRAFGASEASLPLAKDYAFWMFMAALANLPAQSMNCAARAESSVKISSIAVITGALLNVVLDPVFMFDWGAGHGRGGSLPCYNSVPVCHLLHSRLVLSQWALCHQAAPALLPPQLEAHQNRHCHRHPHGCHPDLPFGGILSHQYRRRAPAGCRQHHCGLRRGPAAHPHRLLCGHGLYQPVASYAFGAKQEDRFHQSVRFALKGSLVLTVLVAAAYILLSRPLILLFNQNPVIVDYGRWLLISQVALYPAFGLCYMMTITYQTIGASGYGLFLSMIRQGLFYVPFILVLPKLLGVTGIYLTQPAADLLTILVCLCSIRSMKRIASANMNRLPEGG